MEMCFKIVMTVSSVDLFADVLSGWAVIVELMRENIKDDKTWQ